MRFYGDYHTHSRYSDGHQSIRDIAAAAQKKGVREVAVTDHGPQAAVIGVKSANVYQEIKAEVAAINASGEFTVKVLLGAEANIKSLQGDLDIAAPIIAQLDLLIVGLHPYTKPTTLNDGIAIWLQNSLRHLGAAQRKKAKNNNTKAVVEALYRHPEIDILSHPGLFFAIDLEEVARACIKNEVLFEINCAHEHPNISDIMIVNKLGTDFVVNSDAHFPATVACLDYGANLIKRLGIASTQVANYWDGGKHDDKTGQRSTLAHHYRHVRRR